MVEWNIKAENVLEKRINIEKNQNRNFQLFI